MSYSQPSQPVRTENPGEYHCHIDLSMLRFFHIKQHNLVLYREMGDIYRIRYNKELSIYKGLRVDSNKIKTAVKRHFTGLTLTETNVT